MTTLQEACVKALDSLEQWAALIKHQYTGTSEGMTDLQLADNAGMLAIEALKSALAQQGEQAIGYVRTINGEPTPDDNNTIFSYGENPYRDVMGDEEWVAVYTAAPAPQAHGIREVK